MISRSTKQSMENWIDIGAENITPPWCSVSLLLPYTDINDNPVKVVKDWKILCKPRTTVREKCCDRMKLLNLQLNKAERILRNTQRFGNTVWVPRNSVKESPIQYIRGCKVTQGSETIEFGGSVRLLGVLPLWRVTLPIDTVLATRPTTPTDCWPFRGSVGEIIIELPRRIQVYAVSVEHVRPDTARSAPQHFTIYGILENGTWVKGADGIYSNNKPPKQYFSLTTNHLLLKQIAFRVLSNQGNNKYTCIYRVHLFTINLNKLL